MKDSIRQENINMLFKAVLTLENEEECAGFFKDLLTDTELSSMAQRFMVAKMVHDGKKYDEISSAWTNEKISELDAVKLVDTYYEKYKSYTGEWKS